jgi:hypothetical protein
MASVMSELSLWRDIPQVITVTTVTMVPKVTIEIKEARRSIESLQPAETNVGLHVKCQML